MEATDLQALTRVGTIMGTPTYMAPEQFLAAPCDAVSDQFSFCVVAFEGLFGRRPFEAETIEEMSSVVLAGDAAPPPSDSPVPRRLQAAISRGLAREPGERWPDMASLLAEFDRALGTRRRPWLVAAGLGVVGALAAGAAFLGARPSAPVCEFDERALADAWGDEQRAALLAADAGRSPESTAAIDRALTSWGERWLDGQRRNCVATRVTGSQSAELLDQRSACLERQRREVAAITAALAYTNSSGAFELLDRLPDVAVCDDLSLATSLHPMPRSAAQRESILSAYGEISAVWALLATHQLEEAEERTRRLEAADFDDYPPLALELRYLAVQCSLWRGQLGVAVPELRAVIHDAESARVDELSAELRTALATRIVGQWGPAAIQEAALEEAEIALARLARPDDRRHLALAQARAAWLEDRGDFDAAIAQHHANIEAATQRRAPAYVAKAQQALGRTLVALERFEEAERAYAEARSSFAEAHGAGSVDEVRVDLDLVLLELTRGEFAAAAAGLARLREAYAALLEPGAEMFGMVGLAEAKLALMRGQLDVASQAFERVAERGADDLHRAEAWQGVGVVRFYQGDMVASLEAYARARVDFLRALGPDHPTVALLDSNMGESLAASGDHTAALEAYARALDCLEVALPPGHPDLALPLKARGQSRFALGQVVAARVDLERALKIHEAHPGEPIEHADVEFSLARALVDSEPARARELAVSARERLTQLGYADDAAEVAAWLDELN